MPERDSRGKQDEPVPTLLETIPLPPPDGGDEYKVGPGKPPMETRWQKGQPSPNPRGRPRKQEIGPVSEALSVLIPVTINGKRTKKSARELLYRAVQTKALQGNVPAHKLWNKLQERDQNRRHIEDLQKSSAQNNALSDTSRWLRVQRMVGDLILRVVEELYPGLIDVWRKLEAVGAIQLKGDQVIVADWLQIPSGD